MDLLNVGHVYIHEAFEVFCNPSLFASCVYVLNIFVFNYENFNMEPMETTLLPKSSRDWIPRLIDRRNGRLVDTRALFNHVDCVSNHSTLNGI